MSSAALASKTAADQTAQTSIPVDGFGGTQPTDSPRTVHLLCSTSDRPTAWLSLLAVSWLASLLCYKGQPRPFFDLVPSPSLYEAPYSATHSAEPYSSASVAISNLVFPWSFVHSVQRPPKTYYYPCLESDSSAGFWSTSSFCRSFLGNTTRAYGHGLSNSVNGCMSEGLRWRTLLLLFFNMDKRHSIA